MRGQCWMISVKGGPSRGKRVGVIRHISERENMNWMKKIALLREWSFWHPAWSSKLGMKINFRQFMSVISAKNLRESGIWRPPRGPYKIPFRDQSHFSIYRVSNLRIQRMCRPLFRVRVDNAFVWGQCRPPMNSLMVWIEVIHVIIFHITATKNFLESPCCHKESKLSYIYQGFRYNMPCLYTFSHQGFSKQEILLRKSL